MTTATENNTSRFFNDEKWETVKESDIPVLVKALDTSEVFFRVVECDSAPESIIGVSMSAYVEPGGDLVGEHHGSNYNLGNLIKHGLVETYFLNGNLVAARKDHNATVIDRLSIACEQLNAPNRYVVGDLVTTFELLRGSTRYPLPGQPAMVVDVLEEPISGMVDEDVGVNSPSATDINDVVIAVEGKGGKILRFYFDSRTLIPWVEGANP